MPVTNRSDVQLSTYKATSISSILSQHGTRLRSTQQKVAFYNEGQGERKHEWLQQATSARLSVT